MAVYTSMHRQIKDVCLCRSEFSFWVCGSHHVGRCDTTGTKRDHEEPSSTAGTTKDEGTRATEQQRSKWTIMNQERPKRNQRGPKGTKSDQMGPKATKRDQQEPSDANRRSIAHAPG